MWSWIKNSFIILISLILSSLSLYNNVYANEETKNNISQIVSNNIYNEENIQKSEFWLTLKNTNTDSLLVYSPFDGISIKKNNNIYIYDDESKLVIELSWIYSTTINDKDAINIEKHQIIWLAPRYIQIKTFIKWIPQSTEVNELFLKLLLKNNFENDNFKDIQINKSGLLDYFRKKQYFDAQYNSFFNALNDNSEYTLITQHELFIWKLLTEETFSDIVIKFNNNELNYDTLSIENKELYNKYNEYITYIYSYHYTDELDNKFKDVEEKLINVVSKIYNKLILPEEKDFFSQVIENNKDKWNILWTFKMWTTTRNWFKVPDWKVKIYLKKDIDKNYFLTLSAINNMECGLENGACFNWADAWPFQINQIHRDDFAKSRKMVDKIKSTQDEQIMKDLFEYQLDWTVNRLNRLKWSFCSWKTGDNLTRCMAILHNGNNRKNCYMNGKYIEHKYCYAEWVIKVKRILEDNYKLNN